MDVRVDEHGYRELSEQKLIVFLYLLLRDVAGFGAIRKAAWDVADLTDCEEVLLSDRQGEALARELANNLIVGGHDPCEDAWVLGRVPMPGTKSPREPPPPPPKLDPEDTYSL